MQSIASVRVIPLLNPRDCAEATAPRTFLQSKFWGLFKSRTGWDSYSCSLRLNDSTSLELIVLRRKVARLFSFLYVPFGLSELEHAPDRWALLGDVGRSLSQAFGSVDIFVRFDLPWAAETTEQDGRTYQNRPDKLKEIRIVKGTDVQVPDTVILDISRTEEELLAGMKPKWRYNIRLSEKKGISVREEGEGALEEFMQLYQATARRDKIAIHPLSYYQELFATVSQLQEESRNGNLSSPFIPRINLYIARHEGEALAGIIVLELGACATYLYGASSDRKRNLMPAYALQWHAILSAKQRGATSYDFFGIPPAADDPSHPMAGLYLFKTGFGGTIVHRIGAYDVIVHSLMYQIFRKSEALRVLWHKKIKKGIRRALGALLRKGKSSE